MEGELGKRAHPEEQQSNMPYTSAQSAAPKTEPDCGGFLDFLMPTGEMDIMKEVFSGMPTPR